MTLLHFFQHLHVDLMLTAKILMGLLHASVALALLVPLQIVGPNVLLMKTVDQVSINDLTYMKMLY